MLGNISPFFIVSDLARSIRFYQERLGFELRHSAPEEEPFFAIVGRDQAQILLKAISDEVEPQPNHARHEWAPWDAFVFVDDPDSLAIEFDATVTDREDGLRGFEARDPDGYALFFGRPER